MKTILSLILGTAFLFVATPVLAADSWPGDSGTLIGNAASLGAGYEPSGIVYNYVRDELVMVGDDGDITTMNTDGSNVDTTTPDGSDLEGITIVDGSPNLAYVGVEHPDSIKEYNLDSGTYTGDQWTLTAWMTGSNNLGLEALTFVPNGSHPYTDSDSGGLFYAGLQQDGKIYVFDVDLNTSESVSHIDTIIVNASRTDISGLDYNTDTDLLYVIFDSFNEIVEMQLDETIVNTYTLPGNAQEGIAIVDNCPTETASAYVGEDTGPEVYAYGNYAIACPAEDEDPGSDPDPDPDPDPSDPDPGNDPDTGNDGSDDDTNDNVDDGDVSEPVNDVLLAAAAGPGGGPHIRVFDTEGNWNGTQFFAYDEAFRGGVRLASGDINGDGTDEIITGPGRGGGPHVRIFEQDGTPLPIQFFAFHPDFHGGIDVAAGDTDGDGIDEIAVCQYSDGQAWVKVYKYGTDQEVIGTWNAFGSSEVGCTVTMGDIDLDEEAEVIVGAGNGGGPHIRVFEANGQATALQFFAFHPDSRSGIDVAAADTDGDLIAEIAATQLLGEQAWTKLYATDAPKTVRAEFNAFGSPEVGANVELGNIVGGSALEFLIGPNTGGGPQARVFERDGDVLNNSSFFAYDEGFRGGVSVVGLE